MLLKQNIKEKTTGEQDSQLAMTQKLELSYEDYKWLSEYAKSLGLEVFSTPFDMESIDFLAKENQKIWKIPSGELTNLPYLEKIAQLPIQDKKIILSTGMSTIDEIEATLNILNRCGVSLEILRFCTVIPNILHLLKM